jgi:MocE subfamily Rieske [2Fe-2S] domain protein
MSDIEFHSVAKTADLDEGEAMQVVVGGREIAIYNLGGAFYATDDICTHAYASLADGYIEGEKIECPLHGGCFEIKTGKAVTAPCTEDLKTYPVKVDNGSILVGVPKA